MFKYQQSHADPPAVLTADIFSNISAYVVFYGWGDIFGPNVSHQSYFAFFRHGVIYLGPTWVTHFTRLGFIPFLNEIIFPVILP